MGFIDYVGLPKHPRLVGDLELLDLLNAYRDKKSGYTKSIDMQSADIYFVGVWETVGALALADSLNNFHQESPNNIQHFRQALALDEQRKEFLPVVMLDVLQQMRPETQATQTAQVDLAH